MHTTSAVGMDVQRREDEAISSKGAQASGQPIDEGTYNRTADFTLGDIWNRLERALRTCEGEVGCSLTAPAPQGEWLGWFQQRCHRAVPGLRLPCHAYPPPPLHAST